MKSLIVDRAKYNLPVRKPQQYCIDCGTPLNRFNKEADRCKSCNGKYLYEQEVSGLYHYNTEWRKEETMQAIGPTKNHAGEARMPGHYKLSKANRDLQCKDCGVSTATKAARMFAPVFYEGNRAVQLCLNCYDKR